MNTLNFLDTLLLLQWTGLLGDKISWNYPSWTVSTELLSAVIVFALAMSFGLRALGAICIAVVAAGALYMLAFSIEPSDYGPNALVRTLYGVAMGCLLYRVHRRFDFDWGPVWGTVAEVGGIAAVIVLLCTDATRPYWYLVTFGLAVVIYVFANEQGLVSRASRQLQLHRLGTGSYSIYLNHALVGAIFSKLYLVAAGKLGLSGLASVAVYVPSFVAVLIVYSRFTLRYVERPGQALMMRAWPRVQRLLHVDGSSPATTAFAARKARVLAHAGAVRDPQAYSSRRAASSADRVPASN
jgi:peptidoglycan/LPS O-acetylase OafA/YrhL